MRHALVVSIIACASTAAVFSDRSVDAQGATATELEVLRAGSNASRSALQNLTGAATLEAQIEGEPPSRLASVIVTFDAGARTAWHSHPLGQLLVVTSGTAWVQREGGPKQSINAGEAVWTPPGVKHWHGATLDGAMMHVAVAEALDGSRVTWFEQVTEQEYRR